MVIHFICRGNALRSLIAEAYLKSLGIKNLKVLSSGTVAEHDKANNEGNFRSTLVLLQKHGLIRFVKSHYADQLKLNLLQDNDIVVCMNKRVYDECNSIFQLPAATLVWNVVDLGEEGRIGRTQEERDAYAEDVYQEIVKNVDELVNQLALH